MSHQVGEWCSQVSTDSNSVLVLGLRQLSKILRVSQGQLPPARDLGNFAVGQGLRDWSGGASVVHQVT